MFLRWLVNKGGLLGQRSQQDHCQLEMMPPNSCAHIMALTARRERVEEDHGRRWWNPEGRAGNARSNLFSSPAETMVSPKHLRARRGEAKVSGARVTKKTIYQEGCWGIRGSLAQTLTCPMPSLGSPWKEVILIEKILSLCFPTFGYIRITKNICLKCWSWILS